jgi:DNA-directed RNA polymerase III subunit RPC1
MLASFEKTTDHLFDASFYGKKDKVEGVSECIIMGIPMNVGSGFFRVLQQLRKNDAIPPPKELLFDDPGMHIQI